MGVLPGAERAIVAIEKLRDYCLNPDHIDGKHKAFVFQQLLQWGPDDAFRLKSLILTGILQEPAKVRHEDAYGRRYAVDIPYVHHDRMIRVRTGWIIKTGEDYPRLTSCYITNSSS
jgi:hypothetical protein